MELQWMTAATSVFLLSNMITCPPIEKILLLDLLLVSEMSTKSQSLMSPRLEIVNSVLSALALLMSLTALVRLLFVALPYLLVRYLAAKVKSGLLLRVSMLS